MIEAARFLALTVAYAGVSGYGLFLMKSAPAIVGGKFGAGLLFYGSGFLLWIWMLRTFPLSVAFPAAAGTLIIATQVFGLWLNEEMTALKAGSLLLIAAGVGLLSAQARP